MNKSEVIVAIGAEAAQLRSMACALSVAGFLPRRQSTGLRNSLMKSVPRPGRFSWTPGSSSEAA